jgi:hypothetical protein
MKARKWILLFKGDGKFDAHVIGADPRDFPKDGNRTCVVVEKAAYNELLEHAKRLRDVLTGYNEDSETVADFDRFMEGK